MDVKVNLRSLLVKVFIMDKVMSIYLVNKKTAVNIMSWSTIKQVGICLNALFMINITMVD